jgi:hypothetical protein
MSMSAPQTCRRHVVRCCTKSPPGVYRRGVHRGVNSGVLGSGVPQRLPKDISPNHVENRIYKALEEPGDPEDEESESESLSEPTPSPALLPAPAPASSSAAFFFCSEATAPRSQHCERQNHRPTTHTDIPPGTSLHWMVPRLLDNLNLRAAEHPESTSYSYIATLSGAKAA